ncbi:nucleolar protein 4 [Chrysoperla carnea]|uniref:nucleolar protein 4 n=1 Tax=Chrysoperla carnea TaxID=189513 RepID=UPI001D07BFCC|nr:nucleolar protein 4 [Chrysoperla carnea]
MVLNAPVQTEPVYRKVAIVENFFDIIYNVHVELEGRPGKHAGQKRTYRTITETYAFLPREAVTKFLLGCTDCQRRPRSPSPLTSLISIQSAQQQQQNQPKFLLPPTNNAIRTTTNDKSNNKNETAFPANFDTPKPLITTPPKSNFSSIADLSTSTVTPKDTDSDYTVCDLSDKQLGDDNETPKTRYLGPLRRNILANQFVNDLRKNNTKTPSPPEKNGEFDYNLPITTTYLKHMRTLGYTDEDALKFERYENMSTPEPPEIQEEDPYAGSLMKDGDKLKMILLAWNYHNQATQGGRNNGSGVDSNNAPAGGLIPELPQLAGVNPEDMAGLWASYHSALGLNKGGLLKPSNTPPAPSHREPNSPVMVETGSAHDETSSSGNKEDEDDEDDESDERIDTHSHHDPERLKAFNMFVRLFVDENLDRMVPISKQPKEKIQAIIDSCTRQFPEFAERARKRIRTYLKSCRRNKRARDPSTPWDATRPTPAHLTSVQAEQILATACENESMNAKRMRMGMEPVSQPMPVLPGATTTDSTAPVTPNRSMDFTTSAVTSGVKVETTETSSFTPSSTLTPVSKGGGGLSLISDAKSQGLGITANSLVTSSVTTMNGLAAGGVGSTVGTAAPTAMYRPNFTQAFQRAGATGPYPPTSAIFPSTNTQQAAFNLAAVSQNSSLLPNGPTDLSMKQGPQPQKPLLTHKLSGGEMTAVRQLITGYRESAAFLLRSADELEQLLLQQQQQ